MVAERYDEPIRQRIYRLRSGDACPICGGGQDGHNSAGTQCTLGFESVAPDGRRYAHCGSVPSGHPDPNGHTHAHPLDSPCDCGQPHTGAAERPATRTRKPSAPNTKRIHKTYPPIARHIYYNLDGSIRFSVARLYRGQAKPAHYPDSLDKCYFQRPDGAGDWYNGLEGMPAEGLYRLPEMVAADLWEPVFVVGGELCADAIAELGGVATCNAAGEGKWRAEYGEYFRGRPVVILADDDVTGQQHAQAVAEALGSLAATVRLVTLEGAHDVADWIVAGHTFAELRAITAHAPIIAARKLSALNESFTLQDGPSKTDPSSCPHCQQWKERARIAETTVRNLRAEHAIEDGYLAVPNDTMSAPEKVAAIAMRRSLATKKCDDRVERDAERRPRIYRNEIAQRTGWKESQASANVQKVVALGFFERRERRSRDDTATFYAPGPLYNKPQAASAPERSNTWGGKRIKLCPCGSANLKTYTTRRIVCLDCGSQLESVTTEHDTNAVADDPIDEREEARSLNGSFTLQDGPSNDSRWSNADTQEEGQEYFPPLSILVSNLATAAESAADTDDAGSCWVGGRVPDCEHPERMRHPTNPRLCGCGARYIPALDSAEVRTLTRRHGD